MALAAVAALAFDVFGTVTDWRSTIIDEGREWSARTGRAVDWSTFADAWRSSYEPAMHQVRRGELPWTKIDDLHRMILDRLLEEYGLVDLDKACVVQLPHNQCFARHFFAQDIQEHNGKEQKT